MRMNAARVLPRRAGLAAEARLYATNAVGSCARVENLVAIEIRDRHFGGRNEKQVVVRVAYASSSNFGSCPVPVIVARLTSSGTHISS